MILITVSGSKTNDRLQLSSFLSSVLINGKLPQINLETSQYWTRMKSLKNQPKENIGHILDISGSILRLHPRNDVQDYMQGVPYRATTIFPDMEKAHQ